MLFTGKVKFGRESPILHPFGTFFASKINRRVSRLRNFLVTGILLCTGFTFEVPEHQSYPLSSVLYYTVPVTVSQA
jgi:hypothetical protein